MQLVRSFQAINKTLFFLSFLLVACAQPDWSVLACLATSSLGYALFWHSVSRTTHRFWWGVLWFGAVQAIHLSWFTADRYVGVYIFPFLLILFLCMGAQFGLLTVLIKPQKGLEFSKLLAISGLGVLLEWSRLFVLSGFSWNPIGHALSGTLLSMQFAALFGVFGLTFWILLTNLSALKLFNRPSLKNGGVWVLLTAVPFLFGAVHYGYHSHAMEKGKISHLHAVLVQTALAPEEKMSLNGSHSISPFMQWERIISMLEPYKENPVDLIIFSEAVVPYGTDHAVYSVENVAHVFKTHMGRTDFLPPTNEKKVGNSYWTQALANFFQSDVVIGLEDYSPEQKHSPAYNAGFLFKPYSAARKRYEKRVLVPMGEYIPFGWCKTLLSKYGIEGSFSKGIEAKVFSSTKVPLALSICYEETYGHLMRESRLKGAELLINLSNDVWYPASRLPIVHFLHGRLRSVETGVPLLRSCNTGVTCGVDCLGRIIQMLPYEKSDEKSFAGTLYLSLPLYHYPTLYTQFGDWPIIILSLLFPIFFGVQKIKRKKKASN